MLRLLQPDEYPRWDALAGAAPESGFMQSTSWAAFKRAEGYETPLVGLFDAGDRLIGGGHVHYYPSAHEGFLVCPDGPILPWNDRPAARAGLRELIAFARDAADRLGGLGLRIEPRLPPPMPPLLRNWTRAPVDLTPIHTPIVDLAQPDEALLARMNPKGRYNLKLAQRHGVTITRSTSMSDLKRFHAIFEETGRRNDFFTEPYGFFLNLGAALFSAGIAELLFAEHDGELLAAILTTTFGRRATYLYGASTSERRNAMPNYLLQWEAIRIARERGCVEYDLYGYDPFLRPSHPYAGISRFKMQFGPIRQDRIGAYDLIFYDRVADRLLDRLTD